MFEITATMDAGHAAISSKVGEYETEVEAKERVKEIMRDGFWGDAESFFGSSNPKTESIFYNPRYIKRVRIEEKSG